MKYADVKSVSLVLWFDTCAHYEAVYTQLDVNSMLILQLSYRRKKIHIRESTE